MIAYHFTNPYMTSRGSRGLHFTIPAALSTYWRPEQACAIFQLLADLHEPIWVPVFRRVRRACLGYLRILAVLFSAKIAENLICFRGDYAP
jgi:hypothetical protein